MGKTVNNVKSEYHENRSKAAADKAKKAVTDPKNFVAMRGRRPFRAPASAYPEARACLGQSPQLAHFKRPRQIALGPGGSPQ